jgi:hypothetical protein
MSWIVAQTMTKQLVSKVQHIDLVGALPHEAPQTLNGIGRLNVPMYAGRELVKRQGLLFFLSQAPYLYWLLGIPVP